MTEPRRRILVVDDTKTIRLLVEAMLADDYDVTTAVNASNAVAALHVAAARQALPDLVIVDHVMPGMSGPELVRLLRARPEWRKRPVLGYSASDDASEMIRAGCCETIRKPVKREALLEIIAATLTRCENALGCRYCCHTTTTTSVNPPGDGHEPAGG